MTSPKTALRAARFRIDPEQLPELEVLVLDFPFLDLINGFVDSIKEVMRDPNKKIYVPYRKLNRLLMATCPTLTHGFEKIDYNTGARQALAVGTKVINSQGGAYTQNTCNPPTPEMVLRIIHVWAENWMKDDIFKLYFDSQDASARDLRDRFLKAIKTLPAGFRWNEISTDDLLNHLQSVAFDAIPSLLATLLHEQVSIINGKEVRWRKAQEDERRLSLVSSPPFYTTWEDDYGSSKEGFFGYKVVFSVQTQAGSSKPWIFITTHVQRYAHDKLKDKNDGRDVSFLVGANESRLDDFPTDTTLIRLETRGTVESGEWDDNVADMLKRLGARELASVSKIYQSPYKYWSNEDNSPIDEYYLVHAEGYKYGDERGRGHQLKTGYSLNEINTIVSEILSHLPFLVPDDPLQPDIPAPTGIKTPLAMRDINFLKRSNRQDRQQIVLDALLNTAGSEPIMIMLLWHNPDTYQEMYSALRAILLLEDDEDFPDFITIQSIAIPREALEAVDKTDFQNSRHSRLSLWEAALEALPYNEYTIRLALVELLKGSWQIRGIVREVCAKRDIASQMLQTITVKYDNETNERTVSRSGQGRAESAVRDLLFRQLGVLFGKPSDIFIKAGISEEITQNLSLLAFYLEVTKSDIMYPFAVRLQASGKVDVLFPQSEKGQWISYLQAGPELGRLFRNTKVTFRDRKKYVQKESWISLSEKQLANFVIRVLTEELDTPTIALVEALNWRDGNKANWAQLKNEQLSIKGLLDFGDHNPFETPFDRSDERLNNLIAVVRMRSGSETPQYIPSDLPWGEATDLEDFKSLTGFWEVTEQRLLHYYSVGRAPTTAKGQDNDAYMTDGTGGGIAFKHQQILEFVPFFIRPDFWDLEQQQAICRVAHYLRISPAWTHGNTVFPFPRHIADPLLTDQFCIKDLDE